MSLFKCSHSISVSELLLLLSLVSGSCQASVLNGVVGEEVFLPCVTTEPVVKTTKVFWRDGNDTAVLNIEDSKDTFSSPKYSGRVSSFPEEYPKGNFSIVIRNLRLEDADTYDCDIPDQDFTLKVKLEVTGQLLYSYSKCCLNPELSANT
ncbi:hypothetical protein AMECASPLE_036945 [Ameca splendens]|uniref:Ig-like domain-containing protein n=1 Tax=Ameca splendens TaxID=208324 RepID=A0ABV0Y7N8_9TELE